jgi:hypothetical protein
MDKVQKLSNSEWDESSGELLTDQRVRQCPCQTLQCQPLQFQGGQCSDKNQKMAAGLYLTKVSNGTHTSSKDFRAPVRIYIFCMHFHLLWITTSTLIISLSLPLPPSRAVKKMTQMSAALQYVTIYLILYFNVLLHWCMRIEPCCVQLACYCVHVGILPFVPFLTPSPLVFIFPFLPNIHLECSTVT